MEWRAKWDGRAPRWRTAQGGEFLDKNKYDKDVDLDQRDHFAPDLWAPERDYWEDDAEPHEDFAWDGGDRGQPGYSRGNTTVSGKAAAGEVRPNDRVRFVNDNYDGGPWPIPEGSTGVVNSVGSSFVDGAPNADVTVDGMDGYNTLLVPWEDLEVVQPAMVDDPYLYDPRGGKAGKEAQADEFPLTVRIRCESEGGWCTGVADTYAGAVRVQWVSGDFSDLSLDEFEDLLAQPETQVRRGGEWDGGS